MGQVSGKVTYEGKPVTEGAVLFQPTRGQGAVGKLDQQGRYVLRTNSPGDGAVVGKHTVTVVAPTSIEIIGITGPGQLPKREFPNIPEKYRRPETSGLTAEVKPGSNQFDFDLRKP